MIAILASLSMFELLSFWLRMSPLHIVLLFSAGAVSGGLSGFTQDYLLERIHIGLAAGEAARRGPFEKGRPFSFLMVREAALQQAWLEGERGLLEKILLQ